MSRNLEECFFKFIYSRQLIWYKRFVLKEEPPWTDNEVLQNYRFTNVYRELDRGTQWALRRIGDQDCSVKDKIFQTFWYRLVNNTRFFDTVGLPVINNYDRECWRQSIIDWIDINGTFFHQVYRTCIAPRTGLPRYEILLNIVDQLLYNMDYVESVMSDENYSLEGISKTLCDPYDCGFMGFGPFVAYEILCDLMLFDICKHTDDEWVEIGPGSTDALSRIYGHMPGKQKMGYVKELRDTQQIWFSGLSLPFEQIAYKGKKLSLGNIEHSLCEFGKFLKINETYPNKVRGPRRKFLDTQSSGVWNVI